jgi:hypothetical protein
MKKLLYLKETLVPFLAKKVQSKVIWHDLSTKAEVNNIARSASYIIDSDNLQEENEKNNQILFDEKVFYAERYGGVAISYNGGGARCGYDGRWQIKGIGANLLVGKDSKHVDGELTLTGAALEVLWGNVLAKILPFGVVPNKAILLTNKTITNIAYPNSNLSCRNRALLVRDPVVRPAHFCRAIYYRPSEKRYTQRDDANRVEVLAKQLPYYLPRPSDIDEFQWSLLQKEEKAILGILELATRLATQIAYCRCRHLVMMTSPSNCDMEGRLLDFHGVRSIFPVARSDYGRTYVQNQKLNEDAPLILDGILDICFYLGKYNFGHDFYVSAQQYVLNNFEMAYRKNCLIENLSIAGFDRLFLESIQLTNEHLWMGDELQKILDISPGAICLRYGLGNNDNHPAIDILHDAIDEFVVLNKKKTGTTSHERFINIYRRLCLDYINYISPHQTIEQAKNKMKDIVSRRLSGRSFMSRESIYNEIESLDGNDSDIRERFSAYLSSFESKAIHILK